MSWRFVLQPKWIARHVAVVVLLVSLVLLGLWQLRRLDEKRDIKADVEAKQAQPAVPLQDVMGQGDGQEYRSVTVGGTYRDDDTFIVENRSFNGASGAWILTPLAFGDGQAVVVNRGFLGYDEQGDIAPPRAPTGEVEVEGILLAGERRGRFGADDPDDGLLPVLARVDLGQVRDLVGYDVISTYVQRTSSTPEEATSSQPELVALGPIEPSEGPHLSYAVQWFTFFTIAFVGYGLLLRRVARDQAREEAGAAADAALDRELDALLDADA